MLWFCEHSKLLKYLRLDLLYGLMQRPEVREEFSSSQGSIQPPKNNRILNKRIYALDWSLVETIHRGPSSPLGCVQNNRLDILMMCASSMAIRPLTIRRVKRRTFVLVFFLFLFIQHDGLFVHINANNKATPVKTENARLECPDVLSVFQTVS